jgi:hypothetical protein
LVSKGEGSDWFLREQQRWYAAEPVCWRPARGRLADGPLPAAGWYVDPYCDPLCCLPDGPFPTEAAARAWSRDLAAALGASDSTQAARLGADADALYEAACRKARSEPD